MIKQAETFNDRIIIIKTPVTKKKNEREKIIYFPEEKLYGYEFYAR